MSTPDVVYVCHSGYGCETGCCGYRLFIDPNDDEQVGKFVFGHPDTEVESEVIAFARDTWPAETAGKTVLLGEYWKCYN